MSYFVSVTLTYQFFEYKVIFGELWYLRVIVLFYLFLLPHKKITKEYLFSLEYVALLVIIIKQYHSSAFIEALVWDMRYITLMVTGGIIAIIDKYEGGINKKNAWDVISAITLSFVCFHLNKILYGDITYFDSSFGMFVSVFLLYFAFYFFNKREMLKFTNPYLNKVVDFFNEIAMPLYMLHVTVGISTMYIMKFRMGVKNSYVLCFSAILCSILLSAIVHYYIELNMIKIINRLKG